MFYTDYESLVEAVISDLSRTVVRKVSQRSVNGMTACMTQLYMLRIRGKKSEGELEFDTLCNDELRMP